jgi:hypothetical protein
MKLKAALNEIFGELDHATAVGAAVSRSANQCFAKV